MKKSFIALMAFAAVVLASCGQKPTEEEVQPQQVPSEIICRYGDTIVVHVLMPGYTNYEVTVDGAEHAFVEHDTVYVGCIGKTTMHVIADETTKKDIALTIVPYLSEDVMFTIPSFDWTRTREDVRTELGKPNNTVGPDAELGMSDSCYIYFLDEDDHQFAYYYFSGDDFNTLTEIIVSIADKDHGEILKLFVAERYPYFGRGTMGQTPVWIYYDAPKRADASTMILYYLTGSGWNVSFTPNPYK